MPSVEYLIGGDPNVARTSIRQAVESQGYSVEGGNSDVWTVSRGNQSLTLLLGALAGKNQHLVFTVTFSMANENMIAMLNRAPGRGATAGAIGVSKSATAFAELDQAIGTALSQQGILRNATQHP